MNTGNVHEKYLDELSFHILIYNNVTQHTKVDTIFELGFPNLWSHK